MFFLVTTRLLFLDEGPLPLVVVVVIQQTIYNKDELKQNGACCLQLNQDFRLIT